MLSDIAIETLAHGCAGCSKPFTLHARVISLYAARDVQSFYNQVELGIIGNGVRNFWRHLDCDDPKLEKGTYDMNPDIHHCIRCGQSLDAKDMICPVFRIENPKAVNPNDPTDVGISLGERVYFVHADCKNTSLTKKSHNILWQP